MLVASKGKINPNVIGLVVDTVFGGRSSARNRRLSLPVTRHGSA